MNSRIILASAGRAILAQRAASQTISNARNSSYYKPAASWKPPHFDEMPVPQGPWKALYDTQQKKYNLHLAVGVTFFLFTITFIKTSGIIFFNASPPPLPEDE